MLPLSQRIKELRYASKICRCSALKGGLMLYSFGRAGSAELACPFAGSEALIGEVVEGLQVAVVPEHHELLLRQRLDALDD